MDFDSWWEGIRHMIPTIVKIDAREAWIAATKIERERCTKVCERVQAYHAEKAASLAKTDTEDADFHEAEACGAEDCAEALRMGERWFEPPNARLTAPATRAPKE